MSEEMIPVALDEKLTFKCSPDVSCFNECCRDLNQFLTPYDILRLKQNLGVTSDVFLKKYTSWHNGPETGLPVITFKSDPASGHACPFVTSGGCSVYPDRPASCRMYPLARAVVRSRQTGKLTEYFALIKEPHCKGYERVGTQTIRQWLKGQDVGLHNEMNDRMMEIISLKNQILPGPLDGFQTDKFSLACYDLDRFRAAIFDDDLLDSLDLSDILLEKIKNDDVALLEFGYSWIKHFLFGMDINDHGKRF